ncbi:MAG: hydrogenase maturation nickel metallochaperone HypA [Sedimentisphaeraceae bacterium JB056]
MHELSIASQILNCAIDEAESQGATRITEVEVKAGKLKQIVPEFLNTVWQSITKDTIAESAVLNMIEVDIKARCRKCGKNYSPLPDDFLCPVCKVADAEIVDGDDIILNSITCESDED